MERKVAFGIFARATARITGRPLEEITEETVVPKYQVVQDYAATGIGWRLGYTIADILDQLVLE